LRETSDLIEIENIGSFQRKSAKDSNEFEVLFYPAVTFLKQMRYEVKEPSDEQQK
jgi:hypothetical protein